MVVRAHRMTTMSQGSQLVIDRRHVFVWGWSHLGA